MKIARLAGLATACGTLLLAGCGKPQSGSGDVSRIVLQTDWFPQPEHGGFYQALATGLYEEAGLEVVILPGGPNAMTTQKVLKGDAHFAMNRADTIHALAARDVPVVMVMATLQHDPQAVMVHPGSGIDSLEDLDGKRVMAIPGLAWIKWVEAKYGIEMEIIPHDFGMERFLNDPDFIQQCLLTNEPYYAMREGASPKVLRLAESGFDPYHGIYCLQAFAEDHPDVVSRFVEASIRGWQDFILGDPTPAFQLISRLNPKMDPGFMAFSHGKLMEWKLVTGEAMDGSQVGRIDPERMEAMVRELNGLGIVEASAAPEAWYTTRFLPGAPGK